MLRFKLPSGDKASAGWVATDGRAYVGDAYYYAEKNGHSEVGQRYLDAVAAIAGGTIQHYAKSPPEVVMNGNSNLGVSMLLRDAAAWKAAIATFIDELRTKKPPVAPG